MYNWIGQYCSSLHVHECTHTFIVVIDYSQMTLDDARFVWLPSWPTCPDTSLSINLELPLINHMHPVREFLIRADGEMADNFGALLLAVLGLGSVLLLTRYTDTLEELGHVNIPLMCGPPMAGKTLAATCISFLMDRERSQLTSRLLTSHFQYM